MENNILSEMLEAQLRVIREHTNRIIATSEEIVELAERVSLLESRLEALENK